MEKDTERFLEEHELGVLSTLDREGQVYGSAVYYVYDAVNKIIYIMTKSGTQKYHNMLGDKHVALTMYDEPLLQTLQIRGQAELIGDTRIKQDVFTRINQKRPYSGGAGYPPVTKLTDGSFVIFGITIQEARLLNFSS